MEGLAGLEPVMEEVSRQGGSPTPTAVPWPEAACLASSRKGTSLRDRTGQGRTPNRAISLAGVGGASPHSDLLLYI